MFKTVIWRAGEVIEEIADQDTDQVDELVKRLIVVITKPMSRTEVLQILDLKHSYNFRENYLNPALDNNYVEMTIPEKPNSKNQKYRLTEKGMKFKKQLDDI